MIRAVVDRKMDAVIFDLRPDSLLELHPYQLTMPIKYARPLILQLITQFELCKLSTSVSQHTIIRSKGRIISFELGVNGLFISVRMGGGKARHGDTISWSYVNDWLSNLYDQMR